MGANRYMTYLSANRGNISATLISENPALKGRELMTATTIRAGTMWKALSDDEKDVATEKAVAIIALRPVSEQKPQKTKKPSNSKLTPEEQFRVKQAERRAKELVGFTTKQEEKSRREFAKFKDTMQSKLAD